jgi:NNP family nitrate/nitrite transporter-like MFS transporter
MYSPPPLKSNKRRNHGLDRRPTENEPEFRTQVGAILYLVLIFLLNFTARIVIAPLMPVIEENLGLSHSQAGSLFLLITVGYILTVTASGFVSSRLNHRKTILLSAFLVGLALLFISLVQSLWAIRAGLLGLGMAAGLYLPSGIAMLTSLVSSRHWGKAVAVHELAPNLGFVIAPLLAEAFLPFISWRGVLAFLGFLSVVLGLVFARFGRGGEFKGESPNPKAFKTLLYNPSFWVMVALFGAGISCSLGIYSMLPLYLTAERALDRGLANTLVGLSRITGVATAFVAGWATDRIGPQRTLTFVLLISGLLTLLLAVLPGFWIVIPVFLQPMVAVCFFPAGFAALSRVGPPEVRSIAVSITLPLGFLFAGGAVPILIGLLGDAGSFALGIGIVGILVLAASFLSRYLRFSADPR